MYTILLVVHTIIVFFLILMVLIQRSDSDGMSGLGGGGGNQFMTGRASANLMTRTTAILAAAFMISSLVLAIYAGHMTNHSIIDTVPATESTPPEPSQKDSVTQDATPEPAADTTKKSAKPPIKPVTKASPTVPKPE